jgi:hypothetical protein
MAQTGFTPIQLYSTSTAAAAPVAGNLTNSTLGSELAINITDGKLFYKDNANAVQVIGWKTVPTTAGGTGLTTYTAGDLNYYATGTTFTKLAIGTIGQILTSTGSAPQWSTLSGVAVTTFSAGTTGFTPNSATSGAITLAGTLITSNGGTGLSSYTAGDLSYYASGTALTKLAIGATGRFLSSTGSAPQWNAPAALTKTDDTNVTLTLGGSASTALLNAASLTLGWTGTLAVNRGGTGAATFTTGQVLYGNGTSALNSSANFFFDGTNLGLGTSTPSTGAMNRQLTISSGASNLAGLILINNATGSSFNNGFQVFANGLNAFINNESNGYLAFTTNAAERARIFASGGVSIGNTTDPGATNLSVTGTVGIGGAADSGAKTKISGATGTDQVLYVVNNTGSGNQGGIRTFLSSSANNTNSFHFNGLTDTINNWYLYGNGTSSWSSDERLKKNIETTRNGYIDDVMKLRVVKYNWRNAEEGTPRELGLIAQEVEQVFPGLVQDDFNQLSEDDPILYKQLKGSVLPMILLKALQELKQEFDAYVASHP